MIVVPFKKLSWDMNYDPPKFYFFGTLYNVIHLETTSYSILLFWKYNTVQLGTQKMRTKSVAVCKKETKKICYNKGTLKIEEEP